MLADSIRYRLIYDVASGGYTDWWFSGFGLVLLAVFGIQLRRSMREREPIGKRWLFYAGVLFMALWVVFAFSSTYAAYTGLRDRLVSGQYTLVEGVVQDFRAGDAIAHEPETWSVQSGGRTYHYRYNPAVLEPGYRSFSGKHGPISSGKHVRIADVQGHIARLEVADQ